MKVLGGAAAGFGLILAAYLGYRYVKTPTVVNPPAGNAGSIAPAARAAGTVPLPAGNDRTTLANNLTGAVNSILGTGAGTLGKGPAPIAAANNGNSQAGAAQVGEAAAVGLAGAGVSALVTQLSKPGAASPLTTTPTPASSPAPLSDNPSLSGANQAGLTSADWAYINNPANNAGNGLSDADVAYMANTNNDYGATTGSPWGAYDPYAADETLSSDEYGSFSDPTSYPDPTFSDFSV